MTEPALYGQALDARVLDKIAKIREKSPQDADFVIEQLKVETREILTTFGAKL